MFSPLYLNSTDQDPYKNKFKLIDVGSEKLAGIEYKKIIYQRSHGLLWRIGNCVLGILASITIVPIALNKRDVFNIFKRVMTGKEIKVVYIKKNDKELSIEIKKTKANKNQSLNLKESCDQTNSCNLNLQKSIVQTRKIPPIGLNNTISYQPGEPCKSAHAHGSLFRDDQILEKEEIIRSSHLTYNEEDLEAIRVINKICKLDIKDKIDVYFTIHNKPIIQQQATRGCTAAAAAMLILERGGPVDTHRILNTNLAESEIEILQWIHVAGLNSMVIHLDDKLQTLQKLIQTNGSGIVSIDSDLGGHVVVVDDISEDLGKVRLRDPYHGWEITVSGDTFMSQKPLHCIQIIDKS